MESMKRLEPLFLLLMVLGALNWLIVGLFHTNVVAEIFGAGTVTDVVYVLIGLAGLLSLPKLFDELGHAGGHDVRPHRA